MDKRKAIVSTLVATCPIWAVPYMIYMFFSCFIKVLYDCIYFELYKTYPPKKEKI
jgi:hypothetical protein